MAAAVDSAVFCYLVYHRDDAQLADTIRHLLSQKMFCKLHHEQYSKNMAETLKEEVGKATCVICIITTALFCDESSIELSKLAYDRCQQVFIPIVVYDKPDQYVNLDFLKYCNPIEVNRPEFSHSLCSYINGLGTKLFTAVSSVLKDFGLSQCHSPNSDSAVRNQGIAAAAAARPICTIIRPGRFCIAKKMQLGKAVWLEKILRDYGTSNSTVDYYDREQTIRNLRFPFLLPLLESNIVERHCMQATGNIYKMVLTMPFMSSNLQEQLLLKHGPVSNIKLKDSDTDLDKVSHVKQQLRIAYQLSEAVNFIHRHCIQHGDIQPKYILLDDCMNVRLGGFGHAASHVGTDRNKLETDIVYCCKTFLSMMTLEPVNSYFMKQFECKQPKHTILEKYIKSNVDSALWDIAFTDCLSLKQKLSASDLRDKVKALMDKVGGISLYAYPGNEQCVYCVVGKPRKNMLVQSLKCQPGCPFLKMCPSCMITYGRSPLNGSYVKRYLKRENDRVYRCPSHDSLIFPAIGGPRAFALLIAGSDKDDETIQTTFIRDTYLMTAVIQHQRVMGIPTQNIFRIIPERPKDSKDDKRKPVTCQRFEAAINSIVGTNPDFVLLYYSGHQLDIKINTNNCTATDKQSSELKFPVSISEAREDPLTANYIRQCLCSLASTCPRILAIIDCCEAASLPLSSLSPADSHDDHIRYHVQWSSCGRKQESDLTTSIGSEFTTYLLVGLRGAKTCPLTDVVNHRRYGSHECEICVEFRNDCISGQCIKLNSLRTFVDRHMSEKQLQEGMTVKRRSITSSDCREDPCIAYFTGTPLFSIIYESPEGEIHIFNLDSDDGLQRELWKKMKDCLPPNVPEAALSMSMRLGDSYRMVEFDGELTPNDIESLYVSIRTDGNEVSESKHVACMFDGSQAEHFIQAITSNRPPEIDCEHKRWKLERRDKWQPTRSGTDFETTANKCWAVLQKRARSGNGTQLKYYLVIDVFDNVTILRIMVVEPRQTTAESHLQPHGSNDSPDDVPSCSNVQPLYASDSGEI